MVNFMFSFTCKVYDKEFKNQINKELKIAEIFGI